MSFEKFGPFAPAFEPEGLSVPGYLELFALNEPRAQVALDLIERALSAGDPRPWVDLLLGDPDWRPHLIGAMAVILDEGRSLDPGCLWAAMDRSSWVSPQLAVTAYLVDGRFAARARERLEGGRASAKLCAALAHLCRKLPSSSGWRDGPLAPDVDDAAGIAQRWHDGLLPQFALRGRKLGPKEA